MMCTGTCLGHRGVPGPTFLVLQKQGGGRPRKGHMPQGCKTSVWGSSGGWDSVGTAAGEGPGDAGDAASRDERKKMFPRIQRQPH